MSAARTLVRYNGVAGRCANSPGRGHPRLDGGNVTHATPSPADGLARIFARCTVGDRDDCWEWTGARHVHGYGQMWWNRRLHNVHRLVLQLLGEDLEGRYACHRCDNPPCCNPEHLYAGTPRQNSLDVNERGNWNHTVGERHPYSRLTDGEVREIRRRFDTGEPHDPIAADFGITKQYVGQLGRRLWRQSA